jgi:hypothetical protein
LSNLLATLLFFVISSPVWAGSDLSTAKLEIALEQIQSLKQLPVMVAPADNEIDRASFSVPQRLQKIFDQIQNFIYGRTDLIRLRTCNECRAVSDANRMTIYVDLDFFKDLSDARATFILSHELSHFTLDYMTLLSVDGLSPNGNIPLLRKTFGDYVNIAQYIKMNTAEQRKEMDRYFSLASPAHAEVDLLAIITQKKMGNNLVSEAKALLLDLVKTSTDDALADAQYRLDSLNRIFPNNQ